MVYSCTYMATVGIKVKGLTLRYLLKQL